MWMESEDVSGTDPDAELHRPLAAGSGVMASARCGSLRGRQCGFLCAI